MQTLYFYIVTLSFAGGIFLRSFFVINEAVVVWLLLLALTLALVWRKNRGAVFAPHLICFSLILASFALGIFRLDINEQSSVNHSFESRLGEKIELTGIVAREPEVRAKSLHLYVKAEDELVLVTTDRYATVAYGDAVSVSGALKKPEAFTTDLGRTFNYPGYLKAKGVQYTIPLSQVEVIDAGQGNFILAYLFKIKQTFMRSLESFLPEPQVGLGEGLLLGVKQALGEDIETAFRQTGIIHIVVLSGYNIMLVVAFVMYILGSILPFRLRLIGGVVAIAAFALMVGLSASVFRASLMAALTLGALALGRQYLVLRALMFSGFVMLLLNPYLLVFDPGFQLSFLATLGLILVAPEFEATLASVPKRLGLKDFFVATLATQIAVLPLLLYQIGEFSLVAVIVNMLVLPMVPLAMLTVFLAGLVSLFSTTLAWPFTLLAYATLTYILEIAKWFASLSFAAYVVPPFPFYLVPIAYTLLGVVLYWRMIKTKLKESVNNKAGGRELRPRPPALNPPSPLTPPSDTPSFFR